eukprot:EG_transcript_58554
MSPHGPPLWLWGLVLALHAWPGVPAASPSPEGSPISCLDQPAGWRDSANRTCEQYSSQSWCTFAGTYGDGWPSSYGTFDQYAVNGIDCTYACCACGGGNYD